MTQPGWRRWQLLVVAALALATACMSPRGLEPSPSLIGNPAPKLLSGTCPVTRPVAPERVPKTVKRVIRAGSSEPTKVTFNDWYGNDVLWVALRPGAKILKPPGEELSEKFPWVRLIHGNLTIEGRRLDDASGPCRAQKRRIGPVTRSFFESARLLRLAATTGNETVHRWRDTCFVNIVREE